MNVNMKAATTTKVAAATVKKRNVLDKAYTQKGINSLAFSTRSASF
jgi:hypothetical protein